MKPRLAWRLAATTLLLAACSPGASGPATTTSTSPAAGSPEPSTVSDWPSEPATPSGSSDDTFCSALEAFSATHDTIFQTNTEQLWALLASIVDPSQPAALDAVHVASLPFLAAADDADDALDIVIANTDDPEVAATLIEANDVMVRFARWVGTTGGDTDDIVAFFDELTRRYNEVFNYVITVDREHLDAYAGEACADLHQDTAAQADVTALGNEIALYYFGHEEGPDPVITVADGHYYLLGEDVGIQLSNAALTDQYYNGSTDWCVEVTGDQGSGTTFKYSAADGLQEEACR